MSDGQDEFIEIIAFKLHDQEFCVRTITIREIRGWAAATQIPHAPQEVLGVMNLRGMVIPVINLANKLGMRSTEPTERSAIIVTEVRGMVMGLLVDQVSDIMTVAFDTIQPVPDVAIAGAINFSEGIIAQPHGMICFLNLDRMFAAEDIGSGKQAA
jgi:purine-binding chemotaxis protein CheW